MGKTITIGILVVAVVVVGGILIANMNNSSNLSQTGTTQTGAPSTNSAQSPSGAITTTVTTTTVQPASAPTVATDNSTAVSDATAVLTGRVTPNGAQTSYWYDYGRTNALGTRTASQGIGSGFGVIAAPGFITGLAANTTYFYRLSAQNAVGTVSGATFSFTTNNNPPPQGNAPTTRTNTAGNITQTTANLNGTANPNGSQTSYWFEYGESADLGSVSAFQAAGAGNTSVNTSVSISNLKPLTKYFFRLNAQNQFGTANGAILTFTTQGPANPAGPAEPAATTNGASGVNRTSATLNGHVNPDGAVTTYWFEYSLDANVSNVLGSTPRTGVAGTGVASVAVSAQASGLAANTTYFYRLVAQNSFGTVDGTIVSFQTNR